MRTRPSAATASSSSSSVTASDGRNRRVCGPAAEHEHLLLLAQSRLDLVAQRRVGQVHGAQQPPAAHVADQRRVVGGQAGQQVDQPLAHDARALDEAVGLDHLQDASRAHHVGEVPTPGRVDPRRHGEDVVLDLGDAAARHHAADLQLLAEREQVGLQAQLRVDPGGAGDAGAGLHLVDDEERVVLVRQALQLLEELRPQVVVAALRLDGLHDRAGDVVGVGEEGVLGLAQRVALLGLDRLAVIGDRVAHVGGVDPRPRELREAVDLDRVGVGDRQRVAAAAVERAGEVQDLRAEAGRPARGLVAAGLPVEGGLERVLDGQRAALDEEGPRQLVLAQHAVQRAHELRVVGRVDVGVRGLVERDLQQLIAEVRVVRERGVVHPEGAGRVEREHVEVARAVARVDQPRTAAARRVEHQVVAVDQDVRPQRVVDLGGRDGRTGHGGCSSHGVGREAQSCGSRGPSRLGDRQHVEAVDRGAPERERQQPLRAVRRVQ